MERTAPGTACARRAPCATRRSEPASSNSMAMGSPFACTMRLGIARSRRDGWDRSSAAAIKALVGVVVVQQQSGTASRSIRLSVGVGSSESPVSSSRSHRGRLDVGIGFTRGSGFDARGLLLVIANRAAVSCGLRLLAHAFKADQLRDRGTELRSFLRAATGSRPGPTLSPRRLNAAPRHHAAAVRFSHAARRLSSAPPGRRCAGLKLHPDFVLSIIRQCCEPSNRAFRLLSIDASSGDAVALLTDPVFAACGKRFLRRWWLALLLAP